MSTPVLSWMSARKRSMPLLTDSANSRWSRTDWVNLAVVLGLCCLVGYARWLKMESLVWADPARWLLESSRVAWGEVPYRDFSWQYPPFAVFTLGWAMKWFGVRFLVAMIYIDVVSVIVVLLAFTLIRYLLPEKLRLAAMFLFIAVCATSQTKFALFSFLTYVPALQTGAAGCMLVLAGAFHYLRTGAFTPRNVSALIAGTFVAAVSKPETFVGVAAVLIMLAVVDRNASEHRSTWAWMRRYVVLLVACFVPVLVVYVWVASIAGPRNMIAGLTGYGLASEACPWWPTGLGIFGASAALGQAMMIVALFSVIGQRSDAAVHRRYARVIGPALLGAGLYFSYIIYLNSYLLESQTSWGVAFRTALPTLLWTNAVLIPVMWVSIVCWVYLLWKLWLHRADKTRDTQSAEMLILLTAPVLMCTRGLFNTTLGSITEVSAICYPFFLLLLPYLLWRLIQLSNPGTGRTVQVICLISVLVGYGIIRIAGGYEQAASLGPYMTLSTLAGDIRLLEYPTNAEIYQFVMDHTSPHDTVLDIPYGGGMNVATGRASPAFTTQFRQLRMPDRYMRKDLEQISLDPPKIVIAQDEPDYGTGYGLSGNACAFPKIVWMPPVPRGESDKTLPVVEFIREHYTVVKKIGPKLLLLLKDGSQ